MSDVAAHLVDSVIPHAPVRQWVLSVPRPMRWMFARDASLLSGAIRIFVSEVFRDLRRRSGVKPAGRALCGGVTAVQRFGSSLNLHPHLHSILVDGVFVADGPGGSLRFVPLDPPSQEDLERVLSRTIKRLQAFLARKGYGEQASESETAPDTAQDQPELLDVMQAASIREWIALADGPKRVEGVGRRPIDPLHPIIEKPFCVEWEGFSLHAAVRIGKGDREGLAQLCRYVLRPPFAQERLELLPDGRVLYRLRRPRLDGTSHLILEPVELLEKLAALVPAPRAHVLRYHGLLAPHAKRRKRVVPRDKPARRKCKGDEDSRPADHKRKRRRRKGDRHSDWATLLKRTMGLDPLRCPRCGDQMRFVDCVEDPDTIRSWLRARGLPEFSPRASPARPPPQGRFEFDQE